MTTQNEVAWLIDAIRDNWPTTGSLGGTNPPANVAFRNRDEPETEYPNGDPVTGYETVREKAWATDAYRMVSVSSGSRSQSVFGTDPQYDVETVLDVRVSEKTDWENGPTPSVADHKTLVDFTAAAINSEMTYPDVDPGAEDIGFVEYLELRIEDLEYLSVMDKDWYQSDFSVRFYGNQQPHGT